MRKLLPILVLFSTFYSSAQEITSSTNNESILTIAEQMPSFPGGETEMMKFLQENLRYPQLEKEKDISGKCYVTFVIEKDGSVTGVKILKGVPNGPGCDEEAMRVVKLMPKWNPGKQSGNEVRVQFNLPVKFTLRSSNTLTITDTSYFNPDWERCSKQEAEFYRIIEKQGDAFLVKDMFMKSKRPQMIANCITWEPLVKNGKSTFYYASGAKKKEGEYVKDWQFGTWIFWDEDGRDSSIVHYGKEGKIEFERISKNLPYNNGDDIAELVEVWPKFKGGDEAMMKFIQDYVVYPQWEKEHNISGTCYVTFVVERDGTLSGIKILKGVPKGAGCDKESMRVVSSMPKWIPGTINGKNVRVQFNLPIKFTLR